VPKLISSSRGVLFTTALAFAVVLSTGSACAQTVDPGARLEALVGTQTSLEVQNRAEITVFGVLAVLNNVVLLPLAIGFVIVAVGCCRAAAARPSAWPWLLVAALVLVDLILVGQATLNASLLNRYDYGAYLTGQTASTLGAHTSALLSKVEYTASHVSGPRLWLFQAEFIAASVIGLVVVLVGLDELRKRAWASAEATGLRSAWGAVSFLTALVLAIGLPQTYFAATYIPGR